MLEELRRQKYGLNIPEAAGRVILEQRAEDERIARFTPDNPVKWTQGTWNPFYSDVKRIFYDPTNRREMTDLYLLKIMELQDNDPEFKFQALAGVLTGGAFFASWLADDMELPFVTLGAQPKAHGSRSAVGGVMKDNTTYLTIEDIYSSFTSTATAVENLRAEVAEKYPENPVEVVTHSIAIMSYDWPKTRERAAKANIKAVSLTTFPQLLRLGMTMPLDEGGINEAMERELRAWYMDQEAWSEKHKPEAA